MLNPMWVKRSCLHRYAIRTRAVSLRDNPVYRRSRPPPKSSSAAAPNSVREPIYLVKVVGRGLRPRPTGDVRYPGDLSGDPTVNRHRLFHHRTGHPRSG